jgi:hypothetical protein
MIADLDDHLRSRTSTSDTGAAVPAVADGWAEVR